MTRKQLETKIAELDRELRLLRKSHDALKASLEKPKRKKGAK